MAGEASQTAQQMVRELDLEEVRESPGLAQHPGNKSFREKREQGMELYACNPSFWDEEAGGLGVYKGQLCYITPCVEKENRRGN